MERMYRSRIGFLDRAEKGEAAQDVGRGLWSAARLLLTGGAEVACAAEVSDLRDGVAIRAGTPNRLRVHDTSVSAGPVEEVALVAPAAGGDHVMTVPVIAAIEVAQSLLAQVREGSGAGGAERGT